MLDASVCVTSSNTNCDFCCFPLNIPGITPALFVYILFNPGILLSKLFEKWNADADAISAVRIFTSDKASNTYDLKVSYDTATNTYSASSETFAGLAGTAKAENLVGGAGVDLIYGNAGDDILVGGAGDDILDGGADEDTVNYSGISSDLTVNLGSATEQASSAQSGVDTLIDIENVVHPIAKPVNSNAL